MSKIRRRLLISGVVQGVNFRAYTRSIAKQHGALGWVRNLPDGRVEAVIEGDPEQVDIVIEWCKKGPPYGRVEKISIHEEPVTGEFADFDISRTRW
jgi:acylphosphatase